MELKELNVEELNEEEGSDVSSVEYDDDGFENRSTSSTNSSNKLRTIVLPSSHGHRNRMMIVQLSNIVSLTTTFETLSLNTTNPTAKRFLEQVRSSWGYDVDCKPPAWVDSRLHPIDWQCEVDHSLYHDQVTTAVNCVIDRINTHAKERGKTSECVGLKKAVAASCSLFLLTLAIKDVHANAELTIRAGVSLPVSDVDPEVEECKLISSRPT